MTFYNYSFVSSDSTAQNEKENKKRNIKEYLIHKINMMNIN